MNILLDEDVPEPFVEMLRTLLKGHTIQTVRTMKWTGRKDIPLYQAAAKRGFDVMISGN